ncbi:hypothetical protein RHMOL_Rhmol04G0364000 [Rhododendron molle]|uniref:Uncharacterized protein n=1 Tax=Rhododendron molle TaxID=49168 RepID=A0ACC0P9A8_RHOML|nr:hypothetical protein RHMOL_Rhmol04G0364000 [Rhododendron molle]
MEDKGFAHHREIIPPPINQGFIGSCSAVATGQCLSATVQMMHGGPHDPARRPSLQELIDKTQEAFPNDCYRAVPGEGGFRGFPPEIAFEYIKQYGVAVEANHPYCGQRSSTPTPPDSPRIRIQDYTVIRRNPGRDSPDFDIKPIIRQQPVVGVLTVYESLEQHREILLQCFNSYLFFLLRVFIKEPKMMMMQKPLGGMQLSFLDMEMKMVKIIIGSRIHGDLNGGIMELPKSQHISSSILSIQTWRVSPFGNLERGAHEENHKMKSSNGSSFPFLWLTDSSW